MFSLLLFVFYLIKILNNLYKNVSMDFLLTNLDLYRPVPSINFSTSLFNKNDKSIDTVDIPVRLCAHPQKIIFVYYSNSLPFCCSQ